MISFKYIFFLSPACDQGSYGDNCSDICGHCRDINKCSNSNGKCLTGCDAGFQGELCKTREFMSYVFMRCDQTFLFQSSIRHNRIQNNKNNNCHRSIVQDLVICINIIP